MTTTEEQYTQQAIREYRDALAKIGNLDFPDVEKLTPEQRIPKMRTTALVALRWL